jgi:hypothetical protein
MPKFLEFSVKNQNHLTQETETLVIDIIVFNLLYMIQNTYSILQFAGQHFLSHISITKIV